MNTTTGKAAKGKAPRKTETRPCACGCGRATRATWAPGHDQARKGRLLQRFDAGDEDAGRELVERGWRTEEQLAGRKKPAKAGPAGARLYTEEQAAEVDRLIAQDAEAEGAA